MNNEWRNRLPGPVAFVLSGGATMGALQVGMLRALQRVGLEPEIIVGTSIGTINGAAIAHYGMARGVALLETIWRTVCKEDMFPGGIAGQARQFLRTRNSFYPNTGVARWIDRHRVIDRIEDLPIRFGAVATELTTQRGALFCQGNLRDAILASVAVPGLFPPVAIGDKRYVDGGLIANVPLTAAIEMGAASIVVLDVGNTCRPLRVPTGIGEIILSAFSALSRQRVLIEALLIAKQLPVLYLPVPCPVEAGLMDFRRLGELIAEADAVAGAFLAQAPTPCPGRMAGGPAYHDPERAGGRLIPNGQFT